MATEPTKLNVSFLVKDMDAQDDPDLAERLRALIEHGTIRDAFDAVGMELISYEVVED